MANKEIGHADLKDKYGFKKGAGGQWYNPSEDSDRHVHLIGKNKAPGYDPVTNPKPPEVLSVEKVELKVSKDHRWWGELQTDGTFKFDTAKISTWGLVNKTKANELLANVPKPLIGT